MLDFQTKIFHWRQLHILLKHHRPSKHVLIHVHCISLLLFLQIMHLQEQVSDIKWRMECSYLDPAAAREQWGADRSAEDLTAACIQQWAEPVLPGACRGGQAVSNHCCMQTLLPCFCLQQKLLNWAQIWALSCLSFPIGHWSNIGFLPRMLLLPLGAEKARQDRQGSIQTARSSSSRSAGVMSWVGLTAISTDTFKLLTKSRQQVWFDKRWVGKN